MASWNNVCVFIFDEMSRKSTLSFNSPRDIVAGFKNFVSLGTRTALCNSALVIMVKGLCAKCKQSVGYFLSHNAMYADKLMSVVVTSVEKLSKKLSTSVMLSTFSTSDLRTVVVTY